MPTPFQAHKSRWQNCTRCPLHDGRQQVVFFRGVIPCDLLWCGEAPGQSEDVLGAPFVGPAGQLADEIARRAVPEGVRCAWCNLVGCFPREQKESGENEPPEVAIRACAPKLNEFVALARPRLIVTVGSLARDWLDPKHALKLRSERRLYNFVTGIPQVAITHPAAILRMPTAQKAWAVQKAVAIIAGAIEEHLSQGANHA
jgi:uracil-DNA glycosylase